MADPFATGTELQNFLQLDAITSATATLVLNIASSVIRTHCGWDISQETVTAEPLDGTGERSLWLPTLRLTAIGPVVENGVTLTVGTDYDWTRYGKLVRHGCWPRTARSVVVTYTHGYDEVPDVVKGACLGLAARMYINPEMSKSRSETMGPFAENVSYYADSAGGLSADEQRALGKFTLEPVG